MAAPLHYSHVAAFVDAAAPASGNPAGVVVCRTPPTAAFCQRVAARFNLSETAFVSPRAGGGDADHDLRWFTPTVEVPLCGHATLACAHALFQAGNASPALRFHTLSGVLAVSREPAGGADDAGGVPVAASPPRLAMRFPHNAPRAVDDDDGSLAAALRPLLAHTMRRRDGTPLDPAALLHSVHYSPATRKLVVRLHDACWALLRELAPDTAAMLAADQAGLARLRPHGCADTGGAQSVVTGVSVTVRAPARGAPPAAAAAVAAAAAAAVPRDDAAIAAVAAAASVDGSGADFWSRYFSPWNGIPEDPVNGSSHTVLGPYWAHALGRMALHPSQAGLPDGAGGGHVRLTTTQPLRAWQASPSTGWLGVRVTEVRPLVACDSGRGCGTCRSGVSGAALLEAGGGPHQQLLAHLGAPLAHASEVQLSGQCRELLVGTLPAEEEEEGLEGGEAPAVVVAAASSVQTAPSTAAAARSGAGGVGGPLVVGEQQQQPAPPARHWATAPPEALWAAARCAWPPAFHALFEQPGNSDAELDAAEARLGAALPARVRALMRVCSGAGLPSPTLVSRRFPPEVCLVGVASWCRPPPLLGEELGWSEAQLRDTLVIGYNPEGADYSQPVLLRLSDCAVLGVTENIPEAVPLGAFDEWVACARLEGCGDPAALYLEDVGVQGVAAAAAAAGERHAFYVRLSPCGLDNSAREAAWAAGQQAAFVAALQATAALSNNE